MTSGKVIHTMLTTTKQALTAILAADPSISKEHQKSLTLALLTPASQPLNAIARIIRRDEAARLLGVSVKRVDQLSHAGVLKRITVPGTSRAIGLSEASVRAITEGQEVANG